VNSGLPHIELIVTREQFDLGYLTWGGECCDCSSYKLIRDLPDGRLIVLGRVSQDPTCQIEEWFAASARGVEDVSREASPDWTEENHTKGRHADCDRNRIIRSLVTHDVGTRSGSSIHLSQISPSECLADDYSVALPWPTFLFVGSSSFFLPDSSP